MTGFVLNGVYISVYQIWKEALSVHVHIGRLNGMLANTRAGVQRPYAKRCAWRLVPTPLDSLPHFLFRQCSSAQLLLIEYTDFSSTI
jgi:hypothetical protein